MFKLDCKESWALKYWCFWTVVLRKTLESSLDCKEIQSVHPKGNQLWIFIGRTDAEAETSIFWPPDAKNWLIWKDSKLGRLKVRGERDNSGWDGWMASLTQWTWIWLNSGSWWWTGRVCLPVHGGAKNQTQLCYWTELARILFSYSKSEAQRG